MTPLEALMKLREYQEKVRKAESDEA